MRLKWIGLTICCGVLALAWWFFSPTDRTEKEITGRQAPIFEAHPLKMVKSKIDPILAEEPSEPPRPTSFSEDMSPLTNEEIETVFLNHQRQLQNCWVQRLKDNPKLEGKVAFRIRISTRGRVVDSQLVSSSIDDTLMLQCLNSTFHRFVFREFRGDPIEVQLPLEFEF